jgi:hypothetical protein
MAGSFRMTEEQAAAHQRRVQQGMREVEPGILAPASVAKERKAPEYGEDSKQKALLEWASLVTVGKWKLSDLLTHVPNGGHRSSFEAVNFKLLGVQAGYPDLLLDIPAGPYHGARWEMKHAKNGPTDDQKRWHERLRDFGYYVCIQWEWQDASRDVLRYLRMQSKYTVIERARVPT